MAERLVVFEQPLGLAKFTQQLFWCFDFPRSVIWLNAKLRCKAGCGLTAFLHLLVHQQKMSAFTVGKESAVERKTVDLSLHSELAAHAPGMRNVCRNAGDRPAQ